MVVLGPPLLGADDIKNIASFFGQNALVASPGPVV